MAEHGVRDFLLAKRKAAERYGVVDGSLLPRNTEIEAALQEYQRLFGGESHVETLQGQRAVALDVMHRLQRFQPRLVGPVLTGTATPHDDVVLHVFVDRIETLSFDLMDQGVPHETGERRIRLDADRTAQQPTIRLEVDDQPVERRGVQHRWHQTGAHQPGRWQADAPRRSARSRRVTGDGLVPISAC